MAATLFEGVEHAQVYNVYRPDIPSELVQTMLKYLKTKIQSDLDTAVDVGCGSGQSTYILSPFFRRVIGLDTSQAQIDQAKIHRSAKNIEYEQSFAEHIPLAGETVQLVTASSCLHWFEQQEFFNEVKRVLVPNGCLAAYIYCSIQPLVEDNVKQLEINRLINQTFRHDLEPYWSIDVKSAYLGYRDVKFPFDDVTRIERIRDTFDGTLSDVVGYLTTFSSFQAFRKSDNLKSDEFVRNFTKKLCEILGFTEDSMSTPITLYRDFELILCRKSEN